MSTLVNQPIYLGDFPDDAIVDFAFNTRNAALAPVTLVGGTVAVYKDNGTTEITVGITLTTDFDNRTGLHHVRVDMSASALYSTQANYRAVLTAGTVDSISVIGHV